MTKGAMAIFSSPVIESFGLSGSFSLTSVTPASDVSGRSKAKTTMEMRFIRHLPAELAAAGRRTWRFYGRGHSRPHGPIGLTVAGNRPTLSAGRRPSKRLCSRVRRRLLPLAVPREELDEAAVVLLNVGIRTIELQRLEVLLARLLEV